MIKHYELGNNQSERRKELAKRIKTGQIKFGGYIKGKIYGKLNCNSGKLMKTENRIFFVNEEEAILAGYRPCGHCMREKYQYWKNNRKYNESIDR